MGVKKMSIPWINSRQTSPKQMSVFKSSMSKMPKAKKKKEEELPKEPEDRLEEIKEPETIQQIEEPILTEPEPILTQVEWADQRALDVVDKQEEPFVYPTEITNDIQSYKQGKVCFMTKKSPFSIHVGIDDFLHEPICGDISQHTFEFLDLNQKQVPEMDTKLFYTTTYYPEEPDCRLIFSNIHEMVFLTTESGRQKGNLYTTGVTPLHEKEMEEEDSRGPHLHVRIPVVLGEYKIEMCLEETVTFNDEVMRIKDISKEIILTNFKLVPSAFSSALPNGTRTVLKGNLWMEGYIAQKIEYTAFHDRNMSPVSPMTHLSQKIVAELIVHLLQVQKVRVKR